ncbi:zinc finger BED domain-containing protein 6-like [Melanaphis sacchari]|uniref:zinc finger BED domain-containing protein 6-like n=1 Tax=Melanaphis sacchari TaxID=742174 RepID=UPI000DC12DFD|nr:zinc finger BED domain-containing protein 6-like [Melanaphis sacchari]
MSSNSSNSSTMWKYFDKCDNGGSCKLCRMTVKTCGNTTNLKQHLKRKHLSININVSACKSARSESDPTPFENDEDDPSMVQSTSGTQTTLDTVVVSHSRPTSQCSGYETVLSKGSELSDSISEVSVASNFTVGTSTSRSSSSSCSKQSKLMQPTIAQSFNDIRSFEKGGVKSVSITNSIVYMLVKDNMPLWSTEKDGFKYFMKTVAPMYKIPSRKTITKLISTKYDVLAVQIKNKLSLVENITLTTDIWTDTINTKSYLGMTGHYLSLSKLQLESVMLGVLELQERHTSENIIGWLDNLLKKWGIEKNQVILVVTDSGANIKHAVYNFFGKDKHLPCFAHTLNLVPTLSLGDDILKFWDTHGPIYPNLKKIVEPYLAMVATSVPSERLFSKAGQIVTDCRNRLTGKNLNQIMFLGSLTEKDWHLDLI